jgi:predicted DsbA family dithiol-disulfide isomerase
MKVTYFLDVSSSWCYWAEPAWTELKKRYAGDAEFHWKITHLPAEAYPVSREQCEWFYRRSGLIMRSPFMLNSGWLEPEAKTCWVPNYIAEAAKDFSFTDDRVRLALAHAGLRDGKKIGHWDVAIKIATAAVKGLNAKKLLARAKSKEIMERTDATTREFYALQANQRPVFVLENNIGDRAVFSGLAKAGPIAAAVDAMLADAAAYAAHAAHFGKPPKA